MKYLWFICFFLQFLFCKVGEIVSIVCLFLIYEVDVKEKKKEKKVDDGKNSKIVYCLLQNIDRVL